MVAVKRAARRAVRALHYEAVTPLRARSHSSGHQRFTRPRVDRWQKVARGWATLVAASALGVLACKASPQTGKKSTRGGVYSEEQASRGKDIYLSRCTSCHNVASHTGTTFATLWAGHKLSELYEFIGIRMPKNDPGSLSEQETADVIAYILKMNALPRGRFELPADSAALDKIEIELPNSGK